MCRTIRDHECTSRPSVSVHNTYRHAIAGRFRVLCGRFGYKLLVAASSPRSGASLLMSQVLRQPLSGRQEPLGAAGSSYDMNVNFEPVPCRWASADSLFPFRLANLNEHRSTVTFAINWPDEVSRLGSPLR